MFRPGELTRRFLAGHRVPYVPPIRLYIFISFVFFLLGPLTGGNPLKKEREPKQTAPQQVAAKQAAARRAQVALDSARRELRTSLGARGAGLLASAITDSALARAARGKAKGKRKDSGVNFTVGGLKLPEEEVRRLPAEIEPAQIDSVLKSKNLPLTYVNRLGVRRVVRWSHSTREEVWHQFLRGSSILLFFLMPLAALLLKGFYVRRGRDYLGHLIFTIHLHCFLFVMLTLSILIGRVTPDDWSLDSIPMLVLAAYFVLALRRVYAQSWLKTFVKSLLLSLTYSLALGFSTLVVAIIGLMLF